MSEFTSSTGTFRYTLGQVIYVRISAYNTNGWGSTSTVNTSGATAKTIPATMTAPTRGTETSET